MKSSTLFFLVFSLFSNGWVYSQSTLNTVIAGRVTDTDSSSSHSVSAFIGRFTATRPDRTTADLDEQGFFHLEVQTEQCEEVVINYGGYRIPVIASPGDSIFLNIDAAGIKGPNSWNAIRISGSHARLQQQIRKSKKVTSLITPIYGATPINFDSNIFRIN